MTGRFALPLRQNAYSHECGNTPTDGQFASYVCSSFLSITFLAIKCVAYSLVLLYSHTKTRLFQTYRGVTPSYEQTVL